MEEEEWAALGLWKGQLIFEYKLKMDGSYIPGIARVSLKDIGAVSGVPCYPLCGKGEVWINLSLFIHSFIHSWEAPNGLPKGLDEKESED